MNIKAKKNETYQAIWPKEDFCLAFVDADIFNGFYNSKSPNYILYA